MIATIKVRNSTIDIKPVVFNTNNQLNVMENFTHKNLEKEVKSLLSLPKKTLKKIKTELTKIKKTFESTLMRIQNNKMISNKVMSIGIFSWLNTAGVPMELTNFAETLVLGLGAAIIILAIIVSLIASGMTILGKDKDAEKWHHNVRKGVIQALTSVVIIIILCCLADFLFGGMPGHVPVTKIK